MAVRSGVVLDADRFSYELDLRDLRARDLAQVSGVHEVTISRARHGQPMTRQTLDKLANALDRIPVRQPSRLERLTVAAQAKKERRGSSSQTATLQEVRSGTSTAAPVTE